LAAVMGIVRAHHGALKVSSQPGEGSTFRLLFPATDKTEDRPVESMRPAGVERVKGTILVIDDEPGMRNLARTILENSGFQVLTAADGGDGVRAFRSHSAKVDAVLLDLTMPVMNGQEAAAELRRIRAGVPIILTSGYGEQELAERFAGHAPEGFLKKPYEPAALTQAVHLVLRSRAAKS